MPESAIDTLRDEVTLDESGTQLGDRYRLVRRLGEGGAGVVYAATDERIGAEVAVKVVRSSSRRDEVTLARFHREAKAAGKLGHPNIVRVTDFGTSAKGFPYVVMERLDGETLEARIARDGALDPMTAVDIHIQLADALAAAHAAGVLHRDVKPANVFLTRLATGQILVKLLDFGLAELYEEPDSPRLTERGLLVGSLAYLAPERIEGAVADERSDVYAIGASLYESLTGVLPHSAPNSMMLRMRILEGAVTPVSELRAEVGASVVQIVAGCLMREPELRIATAAEVRRRLLVADDPPHDASDAVGAAKGSAPPSVESQAVPRPASSRGRPTFGLALLVVVSLAVGISVAWSSSGAATAADGETMTVAEPSPTAVASPVLEAGSAPVADPELAEAPPRPSAEAAMVVPLVEAPTTELEPGTRPRATGTARPRGASVEPNVAREPSAIDTEPTAPAPSEPAPSEPSGDSSRFDRVMEPDWGAPLH